MHYAVMAFKILIGSLIFSPKIRVFSKKKKRSSLISLFSPKIKVFSEKKKKKKVFTQNRSLHSEQTSAAD